MTTKSFMFLLVAGLSILTLTFLAGRWTAPEIKSNQQQNTHTVETIPGDTSKVMKASATKIIFHPKPTQLRKDSIVVANFDSVFVDSIGNQITSENTASYNLNSDTWNFVEKIEVKGFDTVIRDTVKVTDSIFVYRDVEIPADQPFYDTFEFGAITVIIIEVLTYLGLKQWAK